MVAVSCAQKMGKLFLELSLAKVCSLSLSLPLSLPLSPPPPPSPSPSPSLSLYLLGKLYIEYWGSPRFQGCGCESGVFSSQSGWKCRTETEHLIDKWLMNVCHAWFVERSEDLPVAFEGLELFEEVLPGGEEMERRNTRGARPWFGAWESCQWQDRKVNIEAIQVTQANNHGRIMLYHVVSPTEA